MWKLWRHKPEVILPTDRITVTNECLNEKYVEELEMGLERGELKASDLDPILVDIIHGEGFFAHDGNYRLEAMKRAGVPTVRAELKKFVRRPPENL